MRIANWAKLPVWICPIETGPLKIMPIFLVQLRLNPYL